MAHPKEHEGHVPPTKTETNELMDELIDLSVLSVIDEGLDEAKTREVLVCG